MMSRAMTAAWALTLACAGCAYRSSDTDTGHVHRFTLQPEAAARCFARNAEEHSSALVAQISSRGGGYDVAVNVRNGLPYATAHIESGGTGARGVIELNVLPSQGTRELLDALVDGC
jgi:hypothetical protein